MAAGLQCSSGYKYASCMVDNHNVVWFQAIVSGADATYMCIKYSVNSDLSSPSYSDVVSGATNAVLRVAIRNLPYGKKYYYRVLFNATGADFASEAGTVPDGEFGDKCFVTLPDGTKPFKFAIIADAHLTGYQTEYTVSQPATIGGTAADVNANSHDGSALEAVMREEMARFADNLLVHQTPDLVAWLGDDIFINDEDTGGDPEGADRETAYKNFGVATSELGIPQIFAEGNHEHEDLGLLAAHRTNGATGKTWRDTYLMHPRNNKQGIYGYLDYGPVRFIYLSPYAYTPASPTEYKQTLGTEQETFLANALKNGNQKLNIILIHNLPFSGKTTVLNADDSLIFNTFGGITLRTDDYSYQNTNAPIFNAIKASGKQAIIFKGHEHLYAREQQQDGVYVYSCPAIFNRRPDPEELTSVQAGGLYDNSVFQEDAYGYRTEGGVLNDHYCATADALAILMVEVNPVGGYITTYGVDAAGTAIDVAGFPRATIPFNLHSDIVTG